MTPQSWRISDQARLLHKIILLQWLNRTPEKPSETDLLESRIGEDKCPGRVFSLQHEADLAKAFAFLAARTDDPRKVVAACVEEGEDQKCLTVRLAMNNGNLDGVIIGFKRMAKIFERVARTGERLYLSSPSSTLNWNPSERNRIEQEQHALLREAIMINQNRILIRLRSHHAKLQCNFKKGKMQRPKIIPQLYKALNGLSVAHMLGIAPVALTGLTDDVRKLHGLFSDLEDLVTPKARSSPGLEILIHLVRTCQHIHDRRILPQALTASSRVEPVSGARIVLTITKLACYSKTSRFMLQAAQKYTVFRKVRISAVHIKAPNLPDIQLDSMTIDLIHSLLNDSKLERVSKFYGSSPIAIEDRIRQEATLAVPVHAEVQLLFHYEQSSCKLPPRIICSSKQACFLCNLFFKMHGRFIVPSTHGRIYEKWALPSELECTGDINSDILTTIRDFVSKVEGTLLREAQSTRRPYPDPNESLILQSAVCSQSTQSTTSTRMSVSPKPVWPEGPTASPQHDSTLRRGSLIPYAEKMATAIPSEDETEALWPRPEKSSTAIIRDLSPRTELPEFVSSEETTSSKVSLLLKKGQPVWCKMSSSPYSFEVRTPQIHLIISQDEIFRNLWSRDTSRDVFVGSDLWIILEYRLEHCDQQTDTVSIVNLLDVPSEREMTVEFCSIGWPRELHMYSNGDVVSIMYSLHRPVEGLEYRI